jgi:SPP1 family phage portal protein
MVREYPFINDDIMKNYRAELRALDENGGVPTIEIIQKILNKHRPKREHMLGLYNRYLCHVDGVPIFHREFEDPSAINNKISNDYFSELINTKVGYFAGAPFSYSYSQLAETNENESLFNNDKTTPQTQADIDNANKVIERFTIRNNIADKDLEITKLAEICGYAGRLLYINTEGEESIKVINPWECVILARDEITEPSYGVWYYTEEFITEGMSKEVKTVEFYNATDCYIFEDGLEGWVLKDQFKHMFDYCPLQGIPNNRELLGGAEKVLSLIDGVDRTISDCNSEVEAFKLAYLLVYGVQIDDKTLEEAKRTGCFNIPPMGATESKIEYLTKQINDTFVENHLNRLEKNIYKFGQTPNFSDEAFASTTSGVAMKVRLFPLETRCAMFERKLHAANIYMFKTLSTAWEKKQIFVDPLEVIIEYKRTFPLDLQYEATVLASLKGNVSDQTALGLMSFIDNPEYEQELMEQEKDRIEPISLDDGMDMENEENAVDGRSDPVDLYGNNRTQSVEKET